jgi:hypothetical protein
MKGSSVKTAYASVTACLSAATLAGRGDCYRAVQLCTIKGTTTVDGRPICYEAWDARVSTEFEYDGQKAQRIWLDPSLLTGYGFVVHPSHAFDLPRRSGKSGTLAIGDTVRITGSIPDTRPVNVIHVLRMTVYPKGNVRFSVS